MKPLCTFLFGLLLILGSCKTEISKELKDDFESDTLSKIWNADKFIPGAFEIQSTCVRSGKKAAKLTLRQGDQIDKEKGTILERAELKEPKKFMSRENLDYSYSFSIFLPPDFPITPNRLVIAQWKQNCRSGKCDPDNPVIALRYESGVFRVTLQTGPSKTTLYSQQESILNKWLDFKFQLRFSRNPTGKVTGFMNGKEIINFEGITAYSQTYGYPDPGDFYFKIGLYRDSMALPMTIFIDDYEKKQ
jgi:hypothetical protein